MDWGVAVALDVERGVSVGTGDGEESTLSGSSHHPGTSSSLDAMVAGGGGVGTLGDSNGETGVIRLAHLVRHIATTPSAK